MVARKKRGILVLLLVLCLLLLSGCSFSDLMSWGTGVKQDPDYQTWEKLSETGKLDKEGKYTADAIHVTFATSNFLEMKYYTDAELKDELPAEGCYLLPGDMIYCAAKVRSDAENYYTFDHLDVIEYSSGNSQRSKLNWKYKDDEATLMIPFDYKGTEISIEPIGQLRLIAVRLEQPKVGGHVLYTVNGQELIGETTALHRGAKIKGILEADTGWESVIDTDPVYVVTEEENQIVTFEGKKADDLFVESDDHRPELKIDINANLKSCRTSIDASGYSAKDLSAGNGGTVVDHEKIGTGSGIKIKFSRFDLLENDKNAVRVTVLKRTDNTEYKEIYYANDANNDIQIDFEYEVTYKAVTLSVEAVKAMALPAVSDSNVEIIAQFRDVTPDNKIKNLPLTEGMLGTNDRQIDVQIIPHDKYTMTGAFTNDGKYFRTMRFDEYERFVKEALQNQLKKMCLLILDSADPHGIVKYLVNGVEVSDRVEILEGQNITINYTLTDTDYDIDENRNIFDQINIFDGERFAKYEKVIPVTRDMDGQTITRDSFIKLRKKVN